MYDYYDADYIHEGFYQAFCAPHNQHHQRTEYSRYDELFRYITRDEDDVIYIAPPMECNSEYYERPYYSNFWGC